MLRRDLIDQRGGVRELVDDNDKAMVGPTLARDVGARQTLQEIANRIENTARECGNTKRS